MKIEEVTISSLEEYIKFVDGLPHDFKLSRGQKDAEWKLLPSGLRDDGYDNRKYSNQTIKSFIDKFKRDSRVYFSSKDILNIKNDLEWTVNARHFGVPTTLLDFSFSPLTSLMFAVEDGFSATCKDSVVWFVNPKKLNKLSDKSELLNISSNNCSEDSLNKLDYPVCIISDMINDRISSQNGCFVYFQYHSSENPSSRSLDKIKESSTFLKKVNIDSKDKKRILASLYKIGYRFTHIYPELDSIVNDYQLEEDVKQFTDEEGNTNE